jgi:uncharacterized protein YjiS (DUF1127 family)
MRLSHIFADKVSFVNGRGRHDISASIGFMEAIMATCTAGKMTNHHQVPEIPFRHPDILTGLRQLLRTWRQRFEQRYELARISERDLNDVGLTWDDVAHEVDKPFWRA